MVVASLLAALLALPLGASARSDSVSLATRGHPPGYTLRVGSGPAEVTFRLREPAGVILLLRLTIPHGARVGASGRIPIAGVGIGSATSDCVRQGAFDVCTQPEEWCPIPAATWRFHLRKLSGAAGTIRLEFRIGQPPPARS